jgi:hypothetical protein
MHLLPLRSGAASAPSCRRLPAGCATSSWGTRGPPGWSCCSGGGASGRGRRARWATGAGLSWARPGAAGATGWRTGGRRGASSAGAAACLLLLLPELPAGLSERGVRERPGQLRPVKRACCALLPALQVEAAAPGARLCRLAGARRLVPAQAPGAGARGSPAAAPQPGCCLLRLAADGRRHQGRAGEQHCGGAAGAAAPGAGERRGIDAVDRPAFDCVIEKRPAAPTCTHTAWQHRLPPPLLRNPQRTPRPARSTPPAPRRRRTSGCGATTSALCG